MHLRDLQRNWDRMGATDPLWAVSTAPEYKNGGWDEGDFFATGRDQVADILRHAADLGLSLRYDGDALDFGCGVGRLTQALAGRFEQVTGVDIAPSMLEQARGFNQAGDRVRYVLNESEDLRSFSDESFDFVYSEIVLMHMEPRYSRSYIREFVRVARPGGVITFQLPEPTSRQQLRDRIPRVLVYAGNKLRTVRTPMMEIYGVHRQEVVADLGSQGVEVVEVEDFEAAGRPDHRYWVRKPD